MEGRTRWLWGMGSLVIGSILIVGLALIYFMLTAWIGDFGVEQVTGQPPSADFVALSAALLTMGGLAGSTYRSVASRMAQEPQEPYEGYEVA
ncbi:MAG: hypothetical protein R3185_07895 [Candidatus Thermoplasmatota archaeon]|nr:hypothetical protein [Candidatus Thermoplasmatota archaeon]